MLKYTGYIEREQRDINPTSPTFNQTRWVRDDLPSNTCPNEVVGTAQVIFYSKEIVGWLPVPNCAQERNTLRILPAGHSTSTVSQLEADYKARQYFESTNAEYVQQYGSCD